MLLIPVLAVQVCDARKDAHGAVAGYNKTINLATGASIIEQPAVNIAGVSNQYVCRKKF